MKRLAQILAFLVLALGQSPAQETFPVNGPFDTRPELYALTNARIIIAPGQAIENATLLIRKGHIEAVGQVSVPEGAVVQDMAGSWIYPAFIDMDSDYGMPEVKTESESEFGGKPNPESKKEGAYNWNQAIRPEISAREQFKTDRKKAEELRALGFGAVLSHQHDGIARGSSVLVSLADAKEQEVILKGEAAAHYSFNKGSSQQDYPGSLMGAIALLRQSYLDAAWYAHPANTTEYNISLDAWNRLQSLPQVFETDDKLNVLRADKLGDEAGVRYIFRGSGTEYQRIEAMRGTGGDFIIPLDFPAAFDVSDPFDAHELSLRALKEWELAPGNPAALEKAGIRFALTAALLEEKKDFLPNLRKAVLYGLSNESALAALTTVPARLLNVSDRLGSLEAGKLANFIVCTGDIFAHGTHIRQNWVQGKQYNLPDPEHRELAGKYELDVKNLKKYTLHIGGEGGKLSLKVEGAGSKEQKGGLSVSDHLLSMSIPTAAEGKKILRLSGWIGPANWTGKAQDADGVWYDWTAKKTGAAKKETPETPEKAAETGKLNYPLGAFGWESPPQAQRTLIKNATIWTCEEQGILENSDVLIDNGKIVQIGQNLGAAAALVIDAGGRHLTPGIIDEHSHIAISRGVNEWTQASSAEVRIGDVINPDDVNIYRQLAGGVTTSQLLHGSANPIGGQSALIKLRWGKLPEEMKFEGADGFIKFALGENVKQSNWGDEQVIRYPQTRMGVEQVFVDYFTRAREYEKAMQQYNTLPAAQKAGTPPPRRDLDLEAVLEIMNRERFITCHSYVQSEINMLMKVAERFGFRINTFTHILEGYKVAEIMREHGAGGSSFSDWWAYKYEVIDAIPHNGAILHKVGVLTAFNSDSQEMARRLNQEAAKAVKYGGVAPQEALKFVTLNPARLLHIEDRVGSIKIGKDADLVLWNADPLSIYASVDQTFVDGILYYDRARNKTMQTEIEAERSRIIAKMLEAKGKGAKTRPAEKEEEHAYHCDDIHDYGNGEVHHEEHKAHNEE